jgi:hypothetical protein
MSGGFLSKNPRFGRRFFARLSLIPHERNRHIFDEKLFVGLYAILAAIVYQ